MKSLLGSVFLCVGLSQAHAGLPIYEPFNYTVGSDLATQSPNGTDFWAATGTGDIIGVASGSLTAPGINSLGNSIAFGGLGITDRVALGGAINSGTVYYSFLFSVTDLGSLNTSGGFLTGFNNSTGPQGTQPSVVGARLVTRLSGSGFNVGLDKSSGTAANFVFDNTLRNVGETIFVVASYTFNPAALDDTTAMWINPDPLTFGLAVAPAPTLVGNLAGTDLGSIASFLFRQGTVITVVPGNVIADELRVDTTWAGVTVPEPASAALLVFAGSGLLLARRRGSTLSR